MSSMTTLEKVCDRVANMARSHHDKMISVDDVSFNDLETICISGEPHRLRNMARRAYVGDWNPNQLFAEMSTRSSEKSSELLDEEREAGEAVFRFDGDEIRSISHHGTSH